VDVDISGDTTYENDETFTVALSNPVNVMLGSTPATVGVTNDDPLPQVSIDDRSVTEGDAGTNQFHRSGTRFHRRHSLKRLDSHITKQTCNDP
jgi:hypothetical protein